MKNKKRTVYVFSATRNYLTEEYKQLMKQNNAKVKKGTITFLKKFISTNPRMQLDTETNVTEFYTDRDLYVIQFGDLEGYIQLVFDVIDIEAEIEELLLDLLKSDTTFYAHGAKFEYIILYKHFKIYIKNFVDTMLASQLLSSGLDTPKGYNGLASLLERTLGVTVSKEEQTTFSREKMTPSQLVYASTDVIYLGKLMAYMLPSLKRWKLLRVFKLENKTIRPLGDMTINGFKINTKALDENIISFNDNALTLKNLMLSELTIAKTDKVKERFDALKIIQPYDEIIINWNSSNQKKLILNYLYEYDFKSTAVKALKDAVKILDETTYLDLFLEKNFEKIAALLVSRHMDFLVKSGLLIKKGTVNINFDSPAQLLALFKIWYPDLTGVGVKAIKKLKHPIITHYKNYAKAQKLCSSFGEKMYNFIEPDGKIHGSFVQLVPSGSRISSRKPNLQQSPSTEQFRRIFIPDEGFKLVDTDYASAELVLAAYLSQDKKMLWAIENKLDLHSYSAYKIFGDAWIAVGGDKLPKGKPKTKEANTMRKKAKGSSFSILYGTGVTAFSENAGMSLAGGKEVLAAYNKTFPELVKFFNESGKFALTNLYIREPYYGRVRFFNRPTNGMEASHVKNAGMNYKPQAANGSITKHAMCLIKRYIDENDLDHIVKIILAIHDEIICMVRNDFVSKWDTIQTHLMEKATWLAIPAKTLKAETDILEHWTKG